MFGGTCLIESNETHMDDYYDDSIKIVWQTMKSGPNKPVQLAYNKDILNLYSNIYISINLSSQLTKALMRLIISLAMLLEANINEW